MQQQPAVDVSGKNATTSTGAQSYYSQYPPLTSPREKAVKYMMLVHEVFLMLIAGIVVLGIGAYTATQTTIINSVCDMLGVYYHVATYSLLIITGSVMLVASIFGLIGTVKNNTCLHLFYLIVVICLFVTFLVVGAIGFAFYTELQDAVKSTLETSIAKYYGINLDADRNTEITTATDAVQRYFSCCGAYGGVNSTRSWYLYQNASAWYQATTVLEGNKAPFVPLSCCKRRADSSVQDQPRCLGNVNVTNAPPANPPPLTGSNAALFIEGCFDAMQSFVSARILVAGAVGISYVVLMLAGIIIGFIFARFLAVADYYGSKYTAFDSSAGAAGGAGSSSSPIVT
ncbi:hypothetical protein BOX15_Mlig003051g2 [Macrostomum lignano]|uniref:Uncharacterized protein n=2 Tax=Macrostomum lignano TaxID=282301 RepID=A0A267FJJ2_9PLAT|nr:hypothetical protein BOX15_Mlig003051g2 [Macrostomum lignano]